MKQLNFILFICLLVFANTGCASDEKVITGLKTEYQINPLGIDIETPAFSWKMISAGTYSARQKAYQLIVAEGKENLSKSKYVYDTGKVDSGSSVCIPYNGEKLEPSTRYFWKVRIWDENGDVFESSETAWFETALMGADLDNAQWIGSDKVLFSKYRADGVFEFDFQIEEGSSQAVFVFGNRDESNFVELEFNMNGNNNSPEFIVSHTIEGEKIEDESVSLSSIISDKERNSKHHVLLNLTPPNYYRQYDFDIFINGEKVIKPKNEENDGNDPFARFRGPSSEFTVIPIPDGSLAPLARIYAIGFKQPLGQNATFSNLKITERKYNSTIYRSDEVYVVHGDGELQTWLPGEDISAPMLRKSFELEKEIKEARLYVTARGIYEMSINGKNVSTDFLNPGWTDYNYRIMYNTYDITDFLSPGENTIGAILGTGWYSDFVGYEANWRDQYGMKQSLLAKLLITYTDGSSETIVTDESWQVNDNGPITANSLLSGVDYDARKEIIGWDKTDYDASLWENASIYDAPEEDVIIQAYIGAPVKAEMVLTAQEMTEPKANTYVYDMGQNMVGIPSIKIKGENGQEVTVRYSEMIYPETPPADPMAPLTTADYETMAGQLYTDNLRGALATDHYIFKGSQNGEIFEPRFTLHGFRYIEISGLETPPALEDVKALVLNSLDETESSKYETSNEKINQLFSNIQWGQRGNFVSIPTDCPQRDERLGWTGDAQIFSRTSTYNANVAPFFKRWALSLLDGQKEDGNYDNYLPKVDAGILETGRGFMTEGAFGWTDAGIIILWQIYQQYGDVSILQQNYESMKRYMLFVEDNATNFIQPSGGYGDWLAIENTSSDLTNTAYTGYDAQIMAQIAAVLGEEEDQKNYEELFENIKDAFNKRYFDSEGNTVIPAGSPVGGNGFFGPSRGNVELTEEPTILNTQTSLALPLYFNMVNDSIKKDAAAHLARAIINNDYCLSTGFLGTPCLAPVLSDYGYDDIAYELFQQNQYPSWLYPVEQGATTIWERWNSYTLDTGFGDVSMNSFNHYSYGAIQEWMIAYSAGIQRDENNPGYKHFILQPKVGGNFTYIKGSYESIYGTIKSGWESENKTLTSTTNAADYGYTYKATVPENTSATLVLRNTDSKKFKIIKGEEGITAIKDSENTITCELTSGEYIIEVK